MGVSFNGPNYLNHERFPQKVKHQRDMLRGITPNFLEFWEVAPMLLHRSELKGFQVIFGKAIIEG